MKKILLFVLLLQSVFGYTQKKQFELNWNGYKELSTIDHKVKIPAFEGNQMFYDFSKGLNFITQWDSDQLIDERSVNLKNVSYRNISVSELGDLDVKTIPSQLKYKLKNSVARGKRSVYFELSPIIKYGNSFKKIISFDIEFGYANNIARNAFSPQVISNSVLSTGDWFKFYVDKSGVFRLNKGFLSSLGANLDNVDPRTVKIYGNGGEMLPYSNSEFYPFDLQENAIKFVGEEDGVFNDNDFILFYAEGPKGKVDVADINTNLNPYTDRSYYFLNISAGFGKRISALSEPTGNPDLIIDTFHDNKFHELDEYNLAKAGRRWFGDRFDIEPTKSFEFEFPNLVASEPVKLIVYAAAVSESSLGSSMQVNVNGSAIETLNFPAIEGENLVTEDWLDNDINVSGSTINVTLNYNNNGIPSALGYLDYIFIEAERALSYSGEQFIFKNNDVIQNSGIVQYNISNTSAVSEIWEITDKYNVTSLINADASNSMSFNAVAGNEKVYLALDSNSFFEPLKDNDSRVENQNIKGDVFLNDEGQFQPVDYIIVAPEIFLTQAERLAQINRDQYNLNVKVVPLNKIYNEFSSGNQDPAAIRNLMSYIYNQNEIQAGDKIKYLCLFGDASYDYKERTQGNTNFVPSWHTYNSFNLTNSLISDDFFGMMDLNEGTMSNSDRLDIAIGRILAYSPQSATELVDKVERYYKEASYGSWRNSFVVVSDDINESWEQIIQQTSNEIADEVVQEKPFLNATKIHADAFQQESTAGGERYPDVTDAFVNAFQQGSLVINYFGHGGEDRLAGERFFAKPDIDNLYNVCKLTCFVTVTCEFTRFDNPLRDTGGEFTYWKNDGGAIALISTTRKIFVSTGISLNLALSEYLFSYGSNDIPSMAESLRLTKNDPSIGNSPQRRLVFYIGDPAMKLAMPKPDIKLTHLNEIPLAQATDTLKALSKVKLSGMVTNEAGNPLTGYDGILSATIYDKDIDRQTLANDGVRENGQLIKLDFTTLGEVIFRGQATVSNGLFDFEFVVPRDIGIPVGNGKVSLYSKTLEPLSDNAGANFDLQIGGINENAPEDNIGPTINLYLNDESFVSGGITNEEPSLLAILEDENGINTASGIGHDIVAIIDNDETNPYVLNNYYETDVDVYTRGKVSYPFRDLEPGLHTLTLKAWDVYNNSSTAEIQFVVYDKDQKLKIENVLNYPNPFVNYTEFWFNHNSSEPLDVSVQIFTVSGKLIRTLNGSTGSNECCDQGNSSLSRSIVWDGRDDFGDKIGKGVYVYKLTVKSNTLNKTVEKFEKLVIL